MTALFALLAACGAAGLAYSVLAQRGARAEPSFGEALLEAQGPGQDLSLRLEQLERKVLALEGAAGKVSPLKAPAEADVSSCEPEPETRQAVSRRPAAAGSVSGRMKAVWEASDRNKGPLEIARDLRMGLSEVDLALKVRKMRPVRG